MRVPACPGQPCQCQRSATLYRPRTVKVVLGSWPLGPTRHQTANPPRVFSRHPDLRPATRASQNSHLLPSRLEALPADPSLGRHFPSGPPIQRTLHQVHYVTKLSPSITKPSPNRHIIPSQPIFRHQTVTTPSPNPHQTVTTPSLNRHQAVTKSSLSHHQIRHQTITILYSHNLSLPQPFLSNFKKR